jgi:hypothetical protein
MSVDTYALTTTAKAKSYLHLSDADLYTDALTIYNTGAGGATAATVEVTDTTMVLVVTTGTNAGTSTLTFSSLTYDTLTELVTEINGLNKGWVANLVGTGASNSGDLVIREATNALLSANTVTLVQVDNYFIERLIDRASDSIERYCDRKFKSQSYSAEKYNGTKSNRLFLKNYPVTGISRVAVGEIDALYVKSTATCAWATVEVTPAAGVYLKIVGGANDGTTALPLSIYTTVALLADQINATPGWSASILNSTGIWPTSYLIPMPAQRCDEAYAYILLPEEPIDNFKYDGNTGILYHPGGFGGGFQNIYVDYTAGYSTIPDDIEHICLEMVAAMYNASEEGGSSTMASERIGDYSYSGGTATDSSAISGLSLNAQRILDSYRRPSF